MISKNECMRYRLSRPYEDRAKQGRCPEESRWAEPAESLFCDVRYTDIAYQLPSTMSYENRPSWCDGEWFVPPEGDHGESRIDATSREYVGHKCPFNSADDCPWWEERLGFHLEQRAGDLSAVGFPNSNLYPEAELLPPEIAEKALCYVRDSLKRPMMSNVVIVGPVGAGKTSVAAYLVAEPGWDPTAAILGAPIADLASKALMLSADDLFERLNEQVEKRLLEVPLLIVDDLGTEMASPIGVRNWHRVVDRRYNDKLPIIVTTNASDVDSLFSDERTRSRFMARCEVWRTERGDLRPWIETKRSQDEGQTESETEDATED